MTYFLNRIASKLAVASIVASVAGLAPAPASAANFFEQLFGGGTPAPVQQAPTDVPSYDRGAPSGLEVLPIHRHKRLVAVRSEPVRQKTTDLAHDRPLHPGDAIVLKTGIEIYDGPSSGKHNMSQFVALSDADISPKAKQQLASMDASRLDPQMNSPLLEGRSVSSPSSRVGSDGVSITKGFKITDAQGKSIRYVGP